MERISANLRENFQKSKEIENKIEKSIQEVGF